MPIRKYGESRDYNRILIVPAGTKHDSGYMHIAIIGIWTEESIERYEICGWPDDISYLFPTITFGGENKFEMCPVRMDCYYPSGVFQFHGRGGKFYVSDSLSSMEVTYKSD